MSTDEVVIADSEPIDVGAPAKPRYYGFSVLLSGFARMWRALLPALVIIAVNAGIQAALVYTNPIATPSNWLMYLQATASLLVLLYTGAVLSAGALESVAPGRVKFSQAYGRANRRFWAFSGWMILLQAVLVAASLVPAAPAAFPWAVWLLWGIFIFLPIAAVDGRRNSLTENFRALGAHPVRWFVTFLVITVLYIVGWLLSAVNTFFITGSLAAGIAGLVGGVVVWWWLTAWACLYCSRLGAEPVAGDAEDGNESAPKAGTAGSAAAAVSETTETTENAGTPESAASESGSVEGEDGPVSAGDSAATDDDSSAESR